MNLANRLAERTKLAAQLLEVDGAPAAVQSDDVTQCIAWILAVVERSRLSARTARERSEKSREVASDLEKQGTSLLKEAGFDSVDSVSRARAEAAVTRLQAAEEAERARELLPFLAELDRRITEGTRFLGGLELIRSRLLDGAFLGELIARRQQSLLGVATKILGGMTNDRFGFSPQFEVVDRLSGQPRSPRTLSGGESFLASLSLALAMVEHAARAGGRLDALFLDEGFGALDNSSLDLALDALEAKADAGRLVALISHVRAVAERISDVLVVGKSDVGASYARWLSDSAVAELIDRDAEDAISGLLS
jgi:exonuclease SbcC